MKIKYLGTCSGTEPMAGMHHTSLIIESGDGLYWFDAGENCAHAAYTGGVDMMKMRALFISHPHMDHVGGLANLLACIRKITYRYKLKLYADNTLHVFFPGLSLFEAIKTLACSGGKGKFGIEMIENEMRDGVIYEDENVRVSAIHNRHLGEDGTNGWHSYSFLIEGEGKRSVCSGDVKDPAELDSFTSGGCDLLIHETGHHAVSDVCDYAEKMGVKSLRFTHHGRAIIEKRDEEEAFVKDFAERCGIPALICYDGMTEEV